MIPEHIIDRGAEAWAGMPLADMHPEDAQNYRDAAQAVLEAVAADIWDEGHGAGESSGFAIARDEWDDLPGDTNPYRNEHT